MSNLHYKYLKLTNGDSLICTTNEECANIHQKQTLLVTDPVTVNHVRVPRGSYMLESYVLMPWIGFTNDSVFEIPINQIVVVSNINDNAKKNYLEFVDRYNTKTLDNFVTNTKQDSEEVNVAKKLMHILGLEETNENKEETERPIRVPGNRTIH